MTMGVDTFFSISFIKYFARILKYKTITVCNAEFLGLTEHIPLAMQLSY
jgi:hypothetical protein